MNEWRDATLGELLTVKHGFPFKGEFFAPAGEEIVLTPGNFPIGGGLRIRKGKERYYTGPYPSEYRLSAGQLLIVMTDLKQEAPILGSPAFVPAAPRMLHNQRLGLVQTKDREQIDRRFLYYLLLCDDTRRQLRATATGSTVRHTAPERIYKVRVKLPSVFVQRRIGAILGSMDDLIENNRRRIELLEQMVQSIYREWFVRFRYPGYEDVNLVDSSVGPIPEGWEVVTVGDLVWADKGLSYKGSYLTESGTPMANLKCFRAGGGFRRDGVKPYSGPFKPKHEVAPGNLIVANTDLTQAGMVIGSPAFVPRRGFESGGLISHHVFVIRNADRASLQLMYEVFRDDIFRNYVRSVASGTTVLGFRPADLLSYSLAWPPSALVQRFGESASDLRQTGEELGDAAERLSATRDLLLPKLVTGQIDVSKLDLDDLVGAVG